MSCEASREILSAALDGEAGRSELEQAERHLADCPRCQEWQRAVHRVNRTVRLDSVSAPDFSGAILAEWDEARRLIGRGGALRLGLVVVGVVDSVIDATHLHGRSLGPLHHDPSHSGRQLAAIAAALGIAFLLSARDGRTRGRLAIVATASLFLVVSAAVDLVAHQTDLTYQLVHLPDLVGTLLLWRLSRIEPPSEMDRPSLRRPTGRRIGQAA